MPAWFFDKHGFTPDTDEDGNIVRRDFDVRVEWRWRNSILTNTHLVTLRRQWKLDKIVEHNTAVNKTLDVKNTILEEDRLAVSDRAAKLGKALQDWTFPEFFKLTRKNMLNFVKARTPGVVKPWKGTINKGVVYLHTRAREHHHTTHTHTQTLNSHKGKVDATPDADTLARIAFRMKDVEPVGHTVTLEDLGMQLQNLTVHKELIKLPTIVDASQFVGPLEHVADVAAASTTVYTEDDPWMQNVSTLFVGWQVRHTHTRPPSLCTRDATRLASMMRMRLTRHLRDRLQGSLTSLRSHWVWRFFAANITRMASIVCWFGHVKADNLLKYAGASELSLLYDGSNLTSRFLPDEVPRTCGRTSRVQSRRWNTNTCGAYLFRDTTLKMWIRSGKVARDGGYRARRDEHVKSGSTPITRKTASFYRAYNDTGGERGNFSSLRSFFAMGFDKKDVKEVCKLFCWSFAGECFRSKCHTGKWTTFDVASVHMLSYMFELTYDLLLQPGKSVSSAPGFEGFLGKVYIDYLRSRA